MKSKTRTAILPFLIFMASCQSGGTSDAPNTASVRNHDSEFKQTEPLPQDFAKPDTSFQSIPAVPQPPPPPPVPQSGMYTAPVMDEEETADEALEKYAAFLETQAERVAAIEDPILSEKDRVLVFAESMPVWMDQNYTFETYLSRFLQYPETAREEGRTGTVGVGFVVESSGKIGRVEIRKSSGYPDFDQEAKRVISQMPDWKPGMVNGKAVAVAMQIPIRFQVE